MDDLLQFRRGAVELAVLQLLAGREVYGGELVDLLGQYGSLATTRGTVYPMLSRLRSSGLVETTWHESPSGPPRRYYRLTADGERARTRRADAWRDLVRDMSTLVPTKGETK
ncbi:MAG: PadR family transcriptional regulator [Propionibacteriaceae bacterium]